ncbi:MAG TPA: dienelactone hydrolase family protein [Thermoanaerobaculia bacterium]|nr:dienelactone hydrolase family protein [Thermoanaerobaculia bacterium]
MRRTVLIACLLLLASLRLPAENVKFKSAAGEAQGYLATPADDKGTHPAIIVIQEWWGLNDWVREQTDRFAKQGYVALAVDLYRGKSTTSADEAHELMRGLPEDRAMADLEGGFNYLASREDVDPKRIGVIGWCMGGGYSLMLAASEPRLAAGVVNYGHLMTDPKTIAGIKVPLLGNFGAEDRGIPAADVRAFEDLLHKKLGKQADFKVYEGAGHAFMNPNNKGGYVAAAAADAWQRIDRFFANHLHAKIPNS